MSDRTSFQAYVYDCPEDQREAAVAAISETVGTFDEWSAGDLAAGVTVYEARCGSAGEVAAALASAAPGASFYLWEDPAYQWLGDAFAYTPALGMFSAECDADGAPLFHPARVLEILAAANGDIEAVKRATGGPWHEDWAAHSAPVR